MEMRKVCVVSGSRADYGLLSSLLRELQAAPDFEMQMVVTGSHLADAHGRTIAEIESDGFQITRQVDILLGGDSSLSTVKMVGATVTQFADVFDQLHPNLVVVVGDRFEIFGVAQAAALLNLPVAHIHGGELTEGNFDESLRHAITKLSHLHFTSTKRYRQRVIQLGERPERVFYVGAPGLDRIRTMSFQNQSSLAAALGLDLQKRPLLVTYHPVTLALEKGRRELDELLRALALFPEREIVITAPNIDPGSEWIRNRLKAFVEAHADRVKIFASLGSIKYLSLMKLAGAVVGNSSSGLIEAPFLGVPAVNIGDRQKGRQRPDTVIDCSSTAEEIYKAIRRAVDAGPNSVLRTPSYMHGDGHSAEKMISIIRALDWAGLIMKPFYDMPHV